MKVATCGCKWCKAAMHKHGNKDMLHATRKGRKVAKALLAKSVRNNEEVDIPTRVRGGWMA